MKKIVVVIFMLFFSSNIGIARSNYFTSNGGVRTFYGYPEDQGMLYVHFFHINAGYVKDEIPNALYCGLSFAPFSFFELSVTPWLYGRYNTSEDYDFGPPYISPLLKFGYPFYFSEGKEGFFLSPGAAFLVDVPLGVKWSEKGAQRVDIKPAYTFMGILGGGVRLFSIHMNTGYRSSHSPGAKVGSIPYNVAMELAPAPTLSFLFEIFNNPPADNLSNTDWFGLLPAIRLSTAELGGVTFDLGVEVGIGDSLPSWKAIFGMTAGFDVIKPPPVTVAELMGKIVDAGTGEPLLATIKFPGTEIEPVHTDPTTGNYSIELPPNVYRVRAIAEGYKWEEKGIVLKEGDKKILDFSLAPKVEPMAHVVGKVTDYHTKEPLKGVEVSFASTDIEKVYTDALGIYKVSVPAGDYTMIFSKEGYTREAQPVALEAGEGKEVNVTLLKKGAKIVLGKIHFRPGSAEIDPYSYPVLDDVVKVLKEHPEAKIEIQGHTDSIGSFEFNMILSQRRAESVKRYLVAHGIDPDRLVARGYGETMPIGDNRTREGQELNRRIEFVVLER